MKKKWILFLTINFLLILPVSCSLVIETVGENDTAGKERTEKTDELISEAENTPDSGNSGGKEDKQNTSRDKEQEPENEGDIEIEEEPEPEPVPEPVPEPEPEPYEWTILVYMAADNNLESYAIEDICEMENSKLDCDKVNLLVLLDRSPFYDSSNGNWSGTKLFQIKTGQEYAGYKITSPEISCENLGVSVSAGTELDMTSSFVLSNAIDYMYEQKSKNYGLIIWGHGSGWRSGEGESETQPLSLTRGFAYDDTSGSYMTLKNLSIALNGGLKGKVLDFLGFDTCFAMGMEVLYELRAYAKYAAGSEGLVYTSGWNYEKLFNQFSESEEMSADALNCSIIEQFKSQYEHNSSAVISAVKLELMDNIFQAFENYMKCLSDCITDCKTRDLVMNGILQNSRLMTQGNTGDDVYADVLSLCKTCNGILEKNISSTLFSKLKQAAAVLCSNFEQFTTGSWACDGEVSSAGIFMGTLSASGLFSAAHPSSYIKGKTIDQIDFVNDSVWYVPAKITGKSFLDKLFYTAAW